MTTAQVVETSATVTNSSFQNFTHLDDHTRQTTDTPGCKPFTISTGSPGSMLVVRIDSNSRQCMRMYEICFKCDSFEKCKNTVTYLVFSVMFASVCVLLEPL